ncbi:MAG: ATP synthase subunit I [Sarcina sp.]
MDKRKKHMMSMVTKNSIIIAILIILILIFINISMAVAFAVGTLVAIINFNISTIVIDRCFHARKSKLFIRISFYIRMLMILGIALLFKENYVNVLSYITGFIIHQIAIITYGMKQAKNI